MIEDKKKEQFLDKLKKIIDVLSNAPKAITGILLIISLLGGAYGSFFKVETDAREAYSVLAPEVEMALEQSDSNTILIENLRKEVGALKESNDILKGLLIAVITSHSTGEVKIEAPPPPPPQGAPLPEPKRPPSMKRRDKQLPYWEQQKVLK